MSREGLSTTSSSQRLTKATSTSCPTPAVLTRIQHIWRWIWFGVCGRRGGDAHGLSVCACFIYRPGWQSSKLQVLMWIWSSSTQHWLLFKVYSSCVLLPSSLPPSLGIYASPSLLPCVSTPVVLLGPSMSRVLQEGLKEDLSKLTFMNSTLARVFGVPDCRITRCGYTGEDGVEVGILCSVHLYMDTENRHFVP